MANILIIEDEVRHCESLRTYLTKLEHRVEIASSAELGCEIASNWAPDLILLDVRLPGIDGLSAVSRLRELVGEIPIVIMMAFGTLDIAAASVRAGVFEYLVKPFSLQELKSVLARSLDAHQSNAYVPTNQQTGSEDQTVIGRSPTMQRIFNRIALVAATDVPVLLTGESGTGKEVMARAIHRYSNRQTSAFVPVFLAALSSGLTESELFGHVRGAFTGAEMTRTGLFEQASGGTVFLDEIGDVPLPSQVKLLRAIEQKEITRVGEDSSRRIDVRFVSATNKSLPKLIDQGHFREDLFYRLSVFHIDLPPLRDRREDIPDLANHFLSRISTTTRCPGFSAAAMSILESRPWAGNIRELRNVVEHAAIAARGSLINENHFPQPKSEGGVETRGVRESFRQLVVDWLNNKLQGVDPTKEVARFHDDLMREIEPVLIETVLERCRGNQSAACRILGMDPKTLKAKSNVDQA